MDDFITECTDRVARGAAYLDEQYPGWERKINLETLQIFDPRCCMFGQLCSLPGKNYGGFTVGLEKLHEDRPDFPGVVSAEHGFSGGRLVTELWITLIKGRFNNGTLSDDH